MKKKNHTYGRVPYNQYLALEKKRNRITRLVAFLLSIAVMGVAVPVCGFMGEKRVVAAGEIQADEGKPSHEAEAAGQEAAGQEAIGQEAAEQEAVGQEATGQEAAGFEAASETIAKESVSGGDPACERKIMYLTFDDGPGRENTDKVLDILSEHNVKATFFLVGENVERYPEVAARIVAEGHTIGIHCYHHDYETIYESVDSYVADFEMAAAAVKKATGVETRLFRFPGGSINSFNKEVYQDIVEEMTDRGYIYFDWNASFEDASKHNDTELLIKNATESTLGRKRVVMLAHDVVKNTTLCLDEILDLFPEYDMLPLTEDTEPIQF